MERRVAIKNISLSLAGLVSLPAWANSGWNLATVQINAPLFSPAQEQILTAIVEAILPETDTLGAKSVGVPAFIQKMLTDCYEKDGQESVKNGLETTDKIAQANFNQSFITSTLSQKQDLLLKFEKSEDAKQKEFYALIKNLTLQGYTTSEYVMTNFLHYNMAPGHYYGCVNVK